MRQEFQETLKEVKEGHKEKLVELQERGMMVEYSLIKEWKSSRKWEDVTKMYVEEFGREITAHGLERRFAKMKERVKK